MKNMSYKKWTLSFFLMAIFALILFCGINYVVDYYHYFRPQKEHTLIFSRDIRKYKMRHIAANPDKYEGFIIGGSKAGALDAALISEYEGMNFYNVCVPMGCFYEYMEYIRYIVENTSAKKIILHISSIEVDYFYQDPVPAFMTGTKRDDLKEYAKYLFLNPAQILTDRVHVPLKLNGSFDYSEPEKRILEEPGYIEREILGLYPENASYSLYRTFNADKELPAFNDNIMALSTIVNLCKSNGVEIEAIIGPTYIYELSKYESDKYWSYLRQIASLVNFWDFSGFLPENRNPYNFMNSEHYNSRVATEMINIIYGKKERDGFGTYVTPTNFEEHINKRIENYFEMKEIFEKNETIELINTVNDPSFIK